MSPDGNSGAARAQPQGSGPGFENAEVRERAAHLARVRLFEDLRETPEALHAFASAMKQREFKPGSDILHEGDTGSELFILIDGQASVYKSTAEGEPYKVANLDGTLDPFFGEGGLLDAEARSATIRAETRCTCLILDNAALERLAGTHPQWTLPVIVRIAKAVMERLRKANTDLMLVYHALVSEIRGH